MLYVGAAGNVTHYLPQNEDKFLHHTLKGVADEIVGIDIDQEGIAHAAKHGLQITYSDCQSMDLGRKFQTIVMLDVIEHLEHSGNALDCLMAHLELDGELIISTPNPASLSMMARSIFHLPIHIYWDHVSSYLPENLQVLCTRHGYRLSETHFFSHPNNWTPAIRIKTSFQKILCLLTLRLNNSFMVIIRHN